jgi:hypothetical protein
LLLIFSEILRDDPPHLRHPRSIEALFVANITS